MTPTTHALFAAFVGIDWAAANHDLCLQAAGTATREGFQLEHTPEAMEAWGTTLRTRLSGHPVAVCLVRTTGPLVSAWRTYDLLGLCPLQPLTLARSRAAFPPSRATDAPTDAALQLARLLTPRDQLQPLQPQRPPMRALAQLVAPRRRVVGDTVRSTHRLTRALKNSFPQVLQWLQDKDPPLVWDFLRRWPPLKAAQRARRSPLEPFLRTHHVRGEDVRAKRMHALTTAPPLTTAEGVSAPTALLVQALGSQLRMTWDAIAAFAPAIAPRAQRHPACSLLQALPGAGPVLASRLLGAFGEQRERSTSAPALPK
jgi:hypothetical protein